jgi:D-aminoacyl-tRNA deacylase
MQALIQRVSQAKVEVESQVVGQIEQGLLVLLGVEPNDDAKCVEKIAHKLINYRVFNDAKGHMNLSVKDVSGSLLVVSQFTLAANTKKGLRPSFSEACPPEKAQGLYEALIEQLKQQIPIQTGRFGADMQVSLTNDGPVTFLLSVSG